MKSERARRVEAWLDGSELDMFKGQVGREPQSGRSRPERAAVPARPAPVGQSGEVGGRSGEIGGWSGEIGGPGGRNGAGPGNGADRRTVTITGRGAERYNPRLEPGARSRPQRRRHERSDFRPDRAALWAVVLCLALVVLAATSAHGATLPAGAARAHASAPAPARAATP